MESAHSAALQLPVSRSKELSIWQSNELWPVFKRSKLRNCCIRSHVNRRTDVVSLLLKSSISRLSSVASNLQSFNHRVSRLFLLCDCVARVESCQLQRHACD